MDPDNIEIVDLYNIVKDQVIVGAMGGLIGLNHLAVLKVLELYEIENRREMFYRILECFHIEQKIIQERYKDV